MKKMGYFENLCYTVYSCASAFQIHMKMITHGYLRLHNSINII